MNKDSLSCAKMEQETAMSNSKVKNFLIEQMIGNFVDKYTIKNHEIMHCI